MNACYEEHRRHRRWTSRIRALPVDGPVSADPTVSVDDRDTLDRAFLRLTPQHRAVFVLHHYAGLALADIAGEANGRALFDAYASTIQLHPENARRPSPSLSPSQS